MKVKIEKFNGELPDYLTVGKVYEVIHGCGIYVDIAGDDGYPAWADIPPPTHEQLVAIADAEKQSLIDQANEYINSKQWPGKASIGRLKGEELVQYNLWLDYLDALELVDTSSAPDIEWPTPPAVQAR